VDSQTATTEQVQELEKLKLPCKCRTRGHQLTAGGTERTFRYFVIQNPSESKKTCFPSRIRFYHSWRTPLFATPTSPK
jgi:hypothetical protein